MRRHRVARVIRILPFAVVAAAVFGLVVMGLWNWLLPPLFGLKPIGFWQALGIFVLSKILFGGFGGRGHRHWHSRHRLIEHWERMTPEEREKFREGLRSRCGSFGATEPKTTQ